MIDCVDVLGRQVTMTENRWLSHILWQRSWMDGWESAVELVVTEPDRIHFDKDFPERECYYRRGTPFNPQRDFKVVVEFDSDGNGTIITAYPARKASPGELHKWP